MFFTLLLFLYWCFLPTQKLLILFLGLYCRSYWSIGPSSDYILAQRPILLGYKYPLLIILLTVTPPNLSQIRSARYVFHHNPRIIVVIHIT
jgi:hypothetical protein